MQVEFRTTALKRRAFSRRRAVRAWGPEVGPAYVESIAFLMSVTDLGELRLHRRLRLHALKGQWRGSWAINLTAAWRLIFEHDEAANAIVITEVTDYHG